MGSGPVVIFGSSEVRSNLPVFLARQLSLGKTGKTHRTSELPRINKPREPGQTTANRTPAGEVTLMTAATRPFTRTCPECGEPVHPGQVRHPACMARATRRPTPGLDVSADPDPVVRLLARQLGATEIVEVTR